MKAFLTKPLRMEIDKITDTYTGDYFHITSLHVGSEAIASKVIEQSLEINGIAPIRLGIEPNLILALYSKEFPEELT